MPASLQNKMLSLRRGASMRSLRRCDSVRSVCSRDSSIHSFQMKLMHEMDDIGDDYKQEAARPQLLASSLSHHTASTRKMSSSASSSSVASRKLLPSSSFSSSLSSSRDINNESDECYPPPSSRVANRQTGTAEHAVTAAPYYAQLCFNQQLDKIEGVELPQEDTVLVDLGCLLEEHNRELFEEDDKDDDDSSTDTFAGDDNDNKSE
jgi:hypothetical protein